MGNKQQLDSMVVFTAALPCPVLPVTRLRGLGWLSVNTRPGGAARAAQAGQGLGRPAVEES